jgi:HK97 gp10 family phage protein
MTEGYKFTSNKDEVMAIIGQKMYDTLDAVGYFVVRDVKMRIKSGPKTGKIYFRRRFKKTEEVTLSTGKKRMDKTKKTGWGAISDYIVHQASAPGESPATDRGQLVNSIMHEIQANKKEEVKLLVGSSGCEYAAGLEFGTVYIEERPFIRPAVYENQAKIIKMLQKGLSV